MKRKIENWTVEKLEKERNSITFPEYQREKIYGAMKRRVCSLIRS